MNFEEYVIISIQNQLERKGRTSVKKDYQSIYHHCCPKQQRLCLLFVQTRTKKRKSVAYVYTDEYGLKKLKCSCVQILWVAHRIK